jgi:hypothetical protein
VHAFNPLQQFQLNQKLICDNATRGHSGAHGIDNMRNQNAYAQNNEKTEQPSTHVHLLSWK